MIDKNIGKRIRERREELGLTQEEFSEKIGVGPNYISLIERGQSFPRYDVLIALLNGLEASSDFIFQDVLSTTAEYKSSQLWDKIRDLPEEKKQSILIVVESLVRSL